MADQGGPRRAAADHGLPAVMGQAALFVRKQDRATPAGLASGRRMLRPHGRLCSSRNYSIFACAKQPRHP
jgi:hypothetical protein